MNRKFLHRLCFIVLAITLIAALGLTAYADEAFGCSFSDANGNTINAYYSEKDDCWYLFVPSTVKLSELKLQLEGDISAVSAGTYDSADGSLAGAFEQGNELTITCAGKEIRVVAMQSTLPAVHIILADASLDQVHLDKDEKYKGSSVYLSDPSGEYDLTAEGSVEFKGRGNSTWNLYEKKGYQIKFDSKTDLMGMGKAKKWVLLANASDDSMMRTQLVYQMAAQMEMAFVPEFEYVDLWINGDYRGTYIIGEKVEIGGSRLDLEDTMGALFEQDDAFYAEEDYWFYSEYLQRHFVLKESVEEDDESVILQAMDSFAKAVDEFADYLFSTPSHTVTLESLSEYIDTDSFAKYYLINEYTLNRESFSTSFYWYRDGEDDVIHLGPIWDFDTCMGNDGASSGSNYGNAHTMFQYLLAVPDFRDLVLELWSEYKPLLQQLDSNADTIRGHIETSAAMNYTRWDALGKPNPKGGNPFCATHAEAVETLKTWLSARESGFSVPRPYVVNADVSEDCSTLTLNFKNGQDYTGLSFAVWSLKGGQDDMYWYTAAKQADGSWGAEVDLGVHNTAGLYKVEAHPEGAGRVVATMQTYIPQAAQPTTWIEGNLSANGSTLVLRFVDGKSEHNELSFAVWTEQNDQDDMAWYTANKQSDGSWTALVDLAAHNGETGMYFIHAYEGSKLVCMKNLYIPRGGGETSIFADISEDKSTISLSLEYAVETDEVWFAVWTESNGHDDLVWYQATGRGMLWTATADVAAHGVGQKIVIHAYKGSASPKEFVIDTSIVVQPDVDESLVPDLRINYNTESRTAVLRLINASQYSKIWIPVWSEANAQDDIVWYEPEKQSDGTWVVTVAMPENGFYALHVYGGYGDAPEIHVMEERFDATVIVPPGEPGAVTLELGEDGILTVSAVDDSYGAVSVKIRCGEGDYESFDAVKNADGSWSVAIPLCRFESGGLFSLEVYADGLQIYTDSFESEAVDHVYDDIYDLICNACGDERPANSVPMYRVYDPNSGEHVYTGSVEERDFLVSAGWNYEGVAFNFPLIGTPVYRLYNPVSGDHLYTMDEDEKARLIAEGWNNEGVAFNSAPDDCIPQYRMWNPNAVRGAWHFTGSVEERNWLLSLGWQAQGIGWYSLLR